jgi:aryl-alcohol dehydrogenase-like predicted oxidoreductase
MEYTELGTTGLRTSVVGLGAGGHSQLGLGTGEDEDHARRVVETAVDLGITLVDTAEDYGTEPVIGDALDTADREEMVVSTKFGIYDDDGELRPPGEIPESLHASLERLGTDYVDVYHLHGVPPEQYDYAAEQLRPRLEELKDEGLIRAVGVTELLSEDPGHEMLARAVDDGGWDAVMVGFNLLNHSARERVLEPAAEAGIGTIGMVAVRRALSDPDVLEATVNDLVESGVLDPDEVDPRDPFGFLVHEDGAAGLIDAAYRFARHEPTVDTVLTGTASTEHLAANVESALRGPLPEEDLALLRERFGDVDSLIGN